MSYCIYYLLTYIKYPSQISRSQVHENSHEKAAYYSYITVGISEYIPPTKYYPTIVIYSQ